MDKKQKQILKILLFASKGNKNSESDWQKFIDSFPKDLDISQRIRALGKEGYLTQEVKLRRADGVETIYAADEWRLTRKGLRELARLQYIRHTQGEQPDSAVVHKAILLLHYIYVLEDDYGISVVPFPHDRSEYINLSSPADEIIKEQKKSFIENSGCSNVGEFFMLMEHLVGHGYLKHHDNSEYDQALYSVTLYGLRAIEDGKLSWCRI